MNRLTSLFSLNPKRLLAVYFTAGYPHLNDTMTIMESIEKGGADIIEIGIPFSDPIADGPTIQASSKVALDSGMTLQLLFEQLTDMRSRISIPVILMGYLNPVIQYGIERFAVKCHELGIDGLILPDMPVFEYETNYRTILQSNGLSNVFLVTPQTSHDRMLKMDELTDSFIYLVSSSSTTGAKRGLSEEQIIYFNRIMDSGLTNHSLIGFGISDNESFEQVCNYSSGAIIGSAFIDMLTTSTNLSEDIISFIHDIKGNV